MVLAGGEVKGVWEMKTHRGQVSLQVKPFANLNQQVHAGVEIEKARLERFLNLKVEVVYV